MILRVSAIPWKLVLCICLLAGVFPTIGMLAIVVLSVGAFMLFIGFLVKCICNVFYADNTEYQKFRSGGGHPYWDLLPPPVNNDSQAVRAGGMPEPQTEFTPPAEWHVQCLTCGARNEDHGVCWNCGANLGATPTPAPRFRIQRTPKPSANRRVLNPRTTDCPGCGRSVREQEFGCFENGVRCPYCATVMQIIPVPPNPGALPRSMTCDHCHRNIVEPVYGSFEGGVDCPCGARLFAAPQAVSNPTTPTPPIRNSRMRM
jgi:hypothetical protein